MVEILIVLAVTLGLFLFITVLVLIPIMVAEYSIGRKEAGKPPLTPAWLSPERLFEWARAKGAK